MNYGKPIAQSLIALRRVTFEERLLGYRLGINLVSSELHYALFGFGKEKFVLYEEGIAGYHWVPHNSLVEELVADGAFGLLIMMMIWGSILYVAMKNVRQFQKSQHDRYVFLSIFAICSLITIMAEGVAANITPHYGIWLFISVILVLHNMQTSGRDQQRQNTGAVPGCV